MVSNARRWIGNFLAHEYDPVKAREYYLRTRELKGRQPGQGEEPESVRIAKQAAVEAEEKAKRVSAERESTRVALKAKLEELEVRVEKLNAAIKKAKLAAMRRAGVSEETLGRMITAEVKSPGSSKGMGSESKEDSSGSESSDSSDKPKTAAQKRKDAKSAKERYEEEKDENPPPEGSDEANQELQDKIDETAARVEKLQEKVQALARIGT